MRNYQVDISTEVRIKVAEAVIKEHENITGSVINWVFQKAVFKVGFELGTGTCQVDSKKIKTVTDY